jgi:hypothetical protein
MLQQADEEVGVGDLSENTSVFVSHFLLQEEEMVHVQYRKRGTLYSIHNNVLYQEDEEEDISSYWMTLQK